MRICAIEPESDAALFAESHGFRLAHAAVLCRRALNSAAAELYLQVHQTAMVIELCQNGASLPSNDSVVEALWRELKVSLETKIIQPQSQKLQHLIALVDLYGNDAEWHDEEHTSLYTEVLFLLVILVQQ